MKDDSIERSPLSRFLFSDTRMAWFWVFVRVYVGWQWFDAGLEKVTNPAWIGGNAGVAISGFLKGALLKTVGVHPDVQGWYAAFLENFVVPHPVVWSYAIAYGELLVGIGLLIGACTGVAAFFGLFMNLNYLLAGTVSTNPILFTLAIGLVLAWRVAGYIGADHWLIPFLSVHWGRNKTEPVPR